MANYAVPGPPPQRPRAACPGRRQERPDDPVLLRRAGHQPTIRLVGQWLPIHSWTVRQVWARISQAGTRPNPVCAAGMPRLPCRFCVLAARSAVILAARLDPGGAGHRAQMEERMGLRVGMPMRDIVAGASAVTGPVTVGDRAT